MKVYHTITLIAAIVILMTPAMADTLALTTGELVSGELVEIGGGVVVFDSPLAGQSIHPIDQVQWLASSAEWQVVLKNGRTLSGRFTNLEDETRLIERENGGEGHRVDLAQVSAATPAPPSQDPYSNDRTPSIQTGILAHQGTEDWIEPYASLSFDWENAPYYLFGSALFAGSDTDEFPRLLRMVAEIRRKTEGKTVFPRIALGFERDTGEALELRGEVSAGLGKTFVQDDGQSLEGDIGLEYVFEQYDSQDLLRADAFRQAVGWGGVGTLTPRGLLRPVGIGSFQRLTALTYYAARENDRWYEDGLGLRLGLDYERNVTGSIALKQGLRLHPSLSDLGEFRAASESTISFPVTSHFRGVLGLRIDYEDTPPLSQLDRWRTSIGASLSWDF